MLALLLSFDVDVGGCISADRCEVMGLRVMLMTWWWWLLLVLAAILACVSACESIVAVACGLWLALCGRGV